MSEITYVIDVQIRVVTEFGRPSVFFDPELGPGEISAEDV